MKRIGDLVLDPATVMALAPLAAVGIGQEHRYAVLFSNGSLVTVDQKHFDLLAAEIVPPPAAK